MWRKLPLQLTAVLAACFILPLGAAAVDGAQRADRARAAETAQAADVARWQGLAQWEISRDRDALRQQLQGALSQRDQERARADEAEAEVQRLKDQMAGLGGGPPGFNHFPYGQCTYWVASKRPVPWYGNAIAWLQAARWAGFTIGSTPRPGAIMVTRESWWGHVAYVEAVAGDGSWRVSEMNYRGWGIVSGRTIRPGGVPLIGFIY